MTSTVTRIAAPHHILGATAWVITGLGVVHFMGILVPEGADHAPWFLLLAIAVPFTAGALVLRVRARAGALIIGVCAALLTVVCVLAVVQGIEPYWGDWLMVLVGG